MPAFFRSRHTHKNTPLPPSAIYFLHLFFFVSPNDRQKWQLRKILHKTKQEEKVINIHFNFIRIKSKEATAEQKKTEKNIKIKEFVETRKMFS